MMMFTLPERWIERSYLVQCDKVFLYVLRWLKCVVLGILPELSDDELPILAMVSMSYNAVSRCFLW